MYAELDRKICSKCKMELSITKFNKDRESPTGYAYVCKPCRNAYRRTPENRKKISDYNKEHRKLNPEMHRAKWRKENLKRNFNITIEEYDALFENQKGKCAICKSTNKHNRIYHTGTLARLCVDHNHATGKIRGLLCDRCNRALGLLGDSVEGLLNAKAYLERFRTKG